jgi:ribosomal protein S10
MVLEYSLKLKSIHFKYLLLGVLALLDTLKKKEQISIIGVQLEKTKKHINKYTVLKSPFVNKKSREQFKLEVSTATIIFSLKFNVFSKGKRAARFFGTVLEDSLLKHLSSQYLEVKLIKSYRKVCLAER